MNKEEDTNTKQVKSGYVDISTIEKYKTKTGQVDLDTIEKYKKKTS
jgi:hypothetical protein